MNSHYEDNQHLYEDYNLYSYWTRVVADCIHCIWHDDFKVSESWNTVFVRHQCLFFPTLPWRHNERDGASNHQPHNCLLNLLFGRRSKKHQSSAPLAFVRGIHRWPVNSPHKGPVTRKMLPFDDVIMSLTNPFLKVDSTPISFQISHRTE